MSAVSALFSSATIDQYAQLGAERVAAFSVRNGTQASVSSPSFGASDALVISCCTCSMPFTEASLDICASHLPSFCTAISPPFSQMKGSALYQSLPGK